MAVRGEVVAPGGSITQFPGLVGPLVAAVIVTAVARGGDGLRDLGARLVRWRVPVRWYLAAALPYLVFLGTLGVVVATGGEMPSLAELAEFSGLPAMAFPLVILLVLVFNGFGEEAGWRGFLTPELLVRRGLLTTSLIVAAAWFTWHIPMFWVVETYRNMGLAVVPMMGFGLVSGAIVLTWIYRGTGGSVLVFALWHLALNLGSATTAGRGLPGVVLWNFVLVWALLIVIGSLIATEPTSRPFMTRLRDGSLIAVLRSPLGRLFPGMTVIGFRGRRSGRALMTPVECVREAGHVYVLVGRPEQKQWWRNVRDNPEVTVEVDGREIPGRASVHAGDSPEVEHDAAVYLAHRPRAARVLSVENEGQPVRPSATEGVAWVRIELQLRLSEAQRSR